MWPSGLGDKSAVENAAGVPIGFRNFCPEVIYKRLSFFSSDLSRYADEVTREMAHIDLKKEGVAHDDLRWEWASITPKHFSDCTLYEIIKRRDGGFEEEPKEVVAPEPEKQVGLMDKIKAYME